ncbi:MAG TPA: hypothetical protein VLN45_09310 [Ignavibacteriaceae bacterium]|nr:hypothetical protein [Ignavibacteriaceae bacterium]
MMRIMDVGLLKPKYKTPYQLIVISPLAKGADQIFTTEIVEFKGSKIYFNPELGNNFTGKSG